MLVRKHSVVTRSSDEGAKYSVFNLTYVTERPHITQYGNTQYKGMTQVVLHYGNTFDICTFHFQSDPTCYGIVKKAHT